MSKKSWLLVSVRITIKNLKKIFSEKIRNAYRLIHESETLYLDVGLLFCLVTS